MLAPGDVVDRYTILAVLGQGGMGAVYHARDERLQRDVALKIVREDEAGLDTEGSARMVREARAVASLAHPNVVTIYDVGEITLPGVSSPTAFLAMELVRGKSLRAFIGDLSVPIARRLAWLVEIAEGLDAVHAIGLVHRDVKPENVMIRDDGRAKVLDFGIAKRANVPVSALSTSAGQVLSTVTSNAPASGTALYMAPEQMLSEPIDGRTDQFAWGIVAYELLAGELPWGPDLDAVKLVAAILTKTPPRLDERALGLTPGIADVVARALAKAPSARFPTMRDVIAALGGTTSSPVDVAARGETTNAIPQTPARAPSRAPSTRVVAFVALALAIVAASALTIRARVTPHVAAPAPSAVAECTTNIECHRLHDASHICQKPEGRCVSLAAPGCTVHASPEALDADDTVWIGAMYPLSGEDGRHFGRNNWQASDLARCDFDATIGSASARAALGKVRRIGIVTCDDEVVGDASARHLVETVRVPAILGFHRGTELLDLGGELLGHDVLSVASMTTNPLVTSMPHRDGQPRLVWRTTYSAVQAASAIGAFIPDVVERDLRKGPAPIVDAAHPLKVAVVRTRDRNLSPLGEAIFATMRFNGKSALENGTTYRELVYERSTSDAASSELARVSDALLLYQPHVVILVAGDEMVTVVGDVEKKWPRAARYRPTWLMHSVLHVDLFPFIGKDADLRHRFFGVTTSSATAPNARFVLHYNETFDDKVSRAFSPNSAYDAFYLIAYGIYALGDEPVTGPAIARAFARLVPSSDPSQPRKTIDVGIAGIFEAYNALRRGGAIDLNGATGALDFDLATGESEFDQDILCVGTDDRGVANDSIESGLVYDAKKKALRGTMKCP